MARTVIVVEDHAPVRELYAEALAKPGGDGGMKALQRHGISYTDTAQMFKGPRAMALCSTVIVPTNSPWRRGDSYG